MKFVLLLFCLLLVILFGLVLIINNNSVLGFGSDEDMIDDFDMTYTRAFCSGQTCRDFLVSCFGSEVVELKAISGFVTFGDNWKDMREKKELC